RNRPPPRARPTNRPRRRASNAGRGTRGGPADAGQARRAEVAFGEVMDLAIRLDGTITGEHGVGRLKRPWLVDQIGPDVLDLSLRVKRALDPLGILNPGAVFAAPTEAR
ncbi:FAD-linked oxidase C-terminal domain-containing protein, partial [Frankia nepalensis]|uniref:FAD-linked oxidase C-terminal domain-containing protein n=1 Tax=Frankia nepalensis TaxID=1836974 RepID=UPI002551D26C